MPFPHLLTRTPDQFWTCDCPDKGLECPLRLLYRAYQGFSNLTRAGFPLDEAWPEAIGETMDAIGEFLWQHDKAGA